MTGRGILGAAELRGLLFRSAGVVASAASALVSLKIFISLGQSDAATYIALVGWLVFVPLGQMGFGRPVYSAVRALHARQALGNGLVDSLVRLFGAQALLSLGLFTLVALVLAQRQGLSGSLLGFLIFALGLTALNASAYQRDLAYATSREGTYEFWEFVRRMTLLAGYGLVMVGLPVLGLGLSALLIAVTSQWFVGRAIVASASTSPEASIAHWRQLTPPIGPDARRFLLITANELVLYNLPLVVFTALRMNAEVVYFGVWIRLFQLLVLPMRMVVDARLNRQMSDYFRGDLGTARQGVITSLTVAVSACAVVLTILFVVQPMVLRWLGAGHLSSDGWLTASLALWCAGNAVQHVFGSFVLSYGGGFSFASKVSSASLLCMVAVAVAAQHWSVGPGGMLFALGVVYTVFAGLYAVHVRRLLRGNIITPQGSPV